MIKRILHLTLKREWFDKIAKGIKDVEFREVKPYWTKRLTDGLAFKKFDEIHFKNGYRKDSPFMRVEHECSWTIDVPKSASSGIKASKVYVLKLGKILEIKNYA